MLRPMRRWYFFTAANEQALHQFCRPSELLDER